MSKKIQKITRNLMMVALSLSLLLGLGFVLTPTALSNPPHSIVTQDDLRDFFATDDNADGILAGSLTTNAAAAGNTGARTLRLGGHTLTVANPLGGTGTLTIIGPGSIELQGGNTLGAGSVVLQGLTAIEIVAGGVIGAGTTGSVTVTGNPLQLDQLTDVTITAGGRLGANNVNMTNVRSLELTAAGHVGGAAGAGNVSIAGGTNITLTAGGTLGTASVTLDNIGTLSMSSTSTIGGSDVATPIPNHTLTIIGGPTITVGGGQNLGQGNVTVSGGAQVIATAAGPNAVIGGANGTLEITGSGSSVRVATQANLGITGGGIRVVNNGRLSVDSELTEATTSLFIGTGGGIITQTPGPVTIALDPDASFTDGTAENGLGVSVTGLVTQWPSGTIYIGPGVTRRFHADTLQAPGDLNLILISGGTLEIYGITAAMDQTLGLTGEPDAGFDIAVTGRGGTINLVRDPSLTAGNADIRGNLLLGSNVTFGDFHRGQMGRSLTIQGEYVDVHDWTSETIKPFYGTITLGGRVGMVTAPDAITGVFELEDSKTLNIGANARLRSTTKFYLGTPGVHAPGAAVINNAGTITLEGVNFPPLITNRDIFEIVGRSTLNNTGVINLDGQRLIVDGLDVALAEGASLVNAASGQIVGGGSITVRGGSIANGISGSFVNAGRVGNVTGTFNPGWRVDLTVGGSDLSAVGARVVNDGTMFLDTVTVGGGAPTDGVAAGAGGTLENNSTLDIFGNLTVGRANGATATAGTLNNDGTLRLDGWNSVVQGGSIANADAGVLTNSEEAELFLTGWLTLGGATNETAAAVEFTNEGEVTAYWWGRFVIEAGSNTGPSAQMINEGSLVLGSDQRAHRSGGVIWLDERSVGNASRATFVNDGVVDVQGYSWIAVDASIRTTIARMGLFQNTEDGLIRVTANHGWETDHYLPTGTFENDGMVTFTFDANRLTTPATDVFGNGIAIGVGPYYWDTIAVARGAWPFDGLGHRQILSVYGNGGRFGAGVLSRAGFNEIHMTAGEARLVDLSVLANFDRFNLMPTLGTESLVGWNVQRDGSGVPIAVGGTVEVIGSLQPGQPNPDVIWAQWVPPTPGISFGDVGAGRFYAAAVRWAANTDPAIARGFQGTNEFRPGRDLTRGQFVTMLYRLAGEPSVAGWSHPFTDVGAGRFYENAIIWAFNHDIITGFSGTTQFRPNVPIERQHVATTLYRMANASPAPANALHGFPDAGDISPYAVNAVNWAVSEGIMGRATGELRPVDRINRGEAVTMIFRAAVERGLLP